MTDNLSSQINLSRDAIRNQITEYIQTYLELENVDLTKSSFLSFLVNTISTLTGNLLFYQTSVYNEFFLTKAQIPESIFNLSAFLGYSPQEASYSTANVLITMPLSFSDPTTTFSINEGFIFKTQENIEFATYYDADITITNNTSATILITEGSKRYNLSTIIEDGNLYFVLPVRQYKTVVQEYQIDADLLEYQFVNIDVVIDGKVSNMIIEVTEPDSSYSTTWTEYSSLYLMDDSTKGFVSRRTDDGRRIYFGNGLIGVQPTPGSTITITTEVTEGADGNVISSTINSGERLYYTNTEGITQIVNYTVTNTSSAINGSDEESLEEIRSNAIASLTSLNRLVTENDFQNLNVIIPNSPFSSNTVSVLKRSDINNNEIQLFTPIEFSDDNYTSDIVPTRNATYDIGLSTDYLPRKTEITIDGNVYYTLFDIDVDRLNQSANYSYIMYEIENIPVLISNYSSDYDIIPSNLIISKEDTKGIFKLYYNSTEINYENCTCELEFSTSGLKFDMINDSTNSYFYYEFDPYTNIPLNQETYYFKITDPSSDLVCQYSSTFVFRKSLYDMMMSNMVIDSTSAIIYDIPVIHKTYYDSINQRDFETQVLQIMMTNISMSDYRMLTDFVNVKFSNTHGYLKNILYNPITKQPVIDILDELPTTANDGDRYICRNQDENYKNYIYECTDSTSMNWLLIEPKTNDIIYINNKSKKYILSDSGWIELGRFQMPLKLDLEIFKDSTYTGSYVELSNTIKDTILDSFSDRFGNNIEIYRSEIIDVIQTIDGVDHCRLIKPETDIFFSYELSDLTQSELISYGVDYVYFTEDDIRIKVY